VGRKDYRDLIVWQRSVDFVEAVYRIRSSFPSRERLGLIAQIRRAAISLPSNIAEGDSRSVRDFLRFQRIARSSLKEAETQLIIACRLGRIKNRAKTRVPSFLGVARPERAWRIAKFGWRARHALGRACH
jgi:four helix bundle protein